MIGPARKCHRHALWVARIIALLIAASLSADCGGGLFGGSLQLIGPGLGGGGDDKAAAAQQLIAMEALEAQEAQKAPFRSLLTGDKLKLFENVMVGKVYGAGGEPLNTPKQLADAAEWFTVTWGDADSRAACGRESIA